MGFSNDSNSSRLWGNDLVRLERVCGLMSHEDSLQELAEVAKSAGRSHEQARVMRWLLENREVNENGMLVNLQALIEFLYSEKEN